MKITKIPFDALGPHLWIMVNLFLMTLLITLRHLDKSGIVDDVFQAVFLVLVIIQYYASSYLRIYKRNKKRYTTMYPPLNLKTFVNLFFLMIFPIGILILVKWKIPSSSEYVLWIVSIIGIVSMLYLFFKNSDIEFDEQEPYIHLIDSKKYLTFIQRYFRVNIPKEDIKSLAIDIQKKELTVDVGEKKVFKMPNHLKNEFEHMQYYFPKEHPEWFN